MPRFQEFSPFDEVSTRRRNLPHWRQRGATYFVTFRQADSLPKAVVRRWAEEREAWLRRHDVDPSWEKSDPIRFQEGVAKIQPRERNRFEREHRRQVNIELDECHGSCLLGNTENVRIVADSLRFFDGERLWIGDFVIMPNHLHALIQPIEVFDLSGLLESIKRFTARIILAKLRAKNPGETVAAPLWQHESFNRIVRNRKELAACRRYIAKNPSLAGLRPAEFLYHAAGWLDEYAARPEPPTGL